MLRKPIVECPAFQIVETARDLNARRRRGRGTKIGGVPRTTALIFFAAGFRPSLSSWPLRYGARLRLRDLRRASQRGHGAPIHDPALLDDVRSCASPAPDRHSARQENGDAPGVESIFYDV